MILRVLNNMRSRPGYVSSFGFFTMCMGFTFYYAPKIENPVLRYALAGTTATLFQEIILHAIDTLNMRAKVANVKKFYVFELIKQEGAIFLTRGIQPVLYGYIFSSIVYFSAYAHFKNKLKKLLYEKEEKPEEQLEE